MKRHYGPMSLVNTCLCTYTRLSHHIGKCYINALSGNIRIPRCLGYADGLTWPICTENSEYHRNGEM